MRRIVVTGLGLVTPLGGDVETSWANILASKSGAGVARGYLCRPELTAEVFLPDPWSGNRGARLYRTGDLGRFLADGSIEFLGRVDHQVKLRGYRIEPGEIEAVLAQHISVHESAVVVQEQGPGDARLVAFVVPEAGEVVLSGDLRAFLKQKLPAYMVPSAIVALDALPTTPNGKVDRRALQTTRAGDTGRRAARQTTRASGPGDDIERRLAAVWEEVLNVRPIGVNDSFFDLGGHSLLTVRLMARVEREFGARLPLSIVFRGGTIASLAEALRHGAAPDVRAPLVRLSGDSVATKPPFYCVHPIGGTVLCYGALARRLGTDRSFCALEAPGLHGSGTPETSVESLAARYVEALRRHQPHGPYFLGGWSFGGVVAYEMACRLAKLGEPVALLALIDSRAPGSLPASAAPVEGTSLVAMLARELGGASGGTGVIDGTGDLGLPETDSSIDRVLARARARGLLPPEIGQAEVRRLLEVLRANLRALHAYLPGSYPGPVTLFRAAGATAPQPDPTCGWRSLATGGVEVHEVPGDHYSIVREPHVRVLSDLLRTRLDDATRRSDSITREVRPVRGERRTKRRSGSPAGATAGESS